MSDERYQAAGGDPPAAWVTVADTTFTLVVSLGTSTTMPSLTSRPDLQHTQGGAPNDEEFDVPSSDRGPLREERILANGPSGRVMVFTVPRA